jgi:CelD/BcsL family acetyltransferase involved in cellulose biosynthesis
MMQPQGLGHGGSSGAPASTPRLFAAEPHEYTVELVRDVETFAALREPWNALVERAGVAHPFLRHEWVQTWWESFGHGARLNVLVVRAAHARRHADLRRPGAPAALSPERPYAAHGSDRRVGP